MAKFLNKNNKGFTLAEMLVAVTIFSIIVAVSIGLFASAVQLQRHGLLYQRLLDQTSYAMEYMSRSLRMAKKDTAGICIIAGANYEITHSGDGIKFLNANNNECWEFYLDSEQLKIDKDDGNPPYELTSADLIVNNFNIYVSGDEMGKQPRVTIFLDIEGRNAHFYSAPRVKIQTTVSQRNLNK